SMINVKSGGITRLSTLRAGLLLLILLLFVGDWLARIAMAALVAVIIMVSICWESIRKLKQYHLSTNIVMVVTVIVV
ncbi:SulP family inorganic anion transporter, partial [Pseudomonas syringae group genomosp. 7]|uniref:SulP family inorganic anion transporter n=1 Tax=Pseudomonas syringae group genomosp. 7 TaxID=251699 RepID=UPI00376F7B88